MMSGDMLLWCCSCRNGYIDSCGWCGWCSRRCFAPSVSVEQKSTDENEYDNDDDAKSVTSLAVVPWGVYDGCHTCVMKLSNKKDIFYIHYTEYVLMKQEVNEVDPEDVRDSLLLLGEVAK